MPGRFVGGQRIGACRSEEGENKSCRCLADRRQEDAAVLKHPEEKIRIKRVCLLLLGLLILGMVGTACNGPTPTAGSTQTPAGSVATKEPAQATVAAVSPTVAPTANRLSFNFGPGDLPYVDTALGADIGSLQVVEETTVGLTRLDEVTNETQPGMAESWVVSSDGLTYTFRLRHDVKWVAYNPATFSVEVVKDAKGAERLVTARDFAYGIRRTLNPRTASDYGYVFGFFIKGADAYNQADPGKLTAAELKKLEDAVAVTAKDDFTLEIAIREPVGFFPNIAGMWQAHAQPQWLIEEKGDRWTETGNYQGYGPYTLKEWAHESHLTLIANPFWPGTAAVPVAKIQEITGRMLPEAASMADYEAGKQEVTMVPMADVERVKGDARLLREFVTAPSFCTYFYGFNTSKRPFNDAKVRLAFSMAIDRQALTSQVTRGGEEAAQWVSRPGLVAAPTVKDYPNLGVRFDLAAAKKLLSDAGYSDVAKLGDISLLYNAADSHKKVAEALQSMWKKNLGVEVKIAGQEWKGFQETLQKDAPQLWRSGWCMDYPDASNFTKELFRTGGLYARATSWSSNTFDALVDKAMAETDLKKRTEMYAQAEKILVYDEAAVMPLYWYARNTLTKPYVKRTFAVASQEHFEKWEILPH